MTKIKDTDLTQAIALLKEHDLQEIEVKDGDKTIRITAKFPESNAHHTLAQPTNNAIAQTQASDPTSAKSSAEPQLGITAPIVGTVYLTPSPNEPPFVKQGQKIKKGQTVCLIEAMKTFNHIQSDIDAVVTNICVENGETVEYGQTLITLEAIQA